MVPHWLQRTNLLIGEKAIDQLINARVLIVGLGGVGSYAAEFLSRSGVGHITIVDGDVVDPTNKNRQLPALDSNINLSKAVLMGQRIKDINPDVNLTVIEEFLEPTRMEELVQSGFDYVFDCIDSIQPKVSLILNCLNHDVKIVSSMGAGGRIDPSRVQLASLQNTHNCPFAQQIRKALKKNKANLRKVTAVFSDETVFKENIMLTDGTRYKKSFYGTISYIPALFGLYMASFVIRSIIGRYGKKHEEDIQLFN